MGICLTDLNMVAQLAGWTTPQARDAKGVTQNFCNPDKPKDDSLCDQVMDMAGWDTPTVANADKEVPGSKQGMMRVLASGPATTSSPAGTEKRGVLNPALPRWLQGYPVEWCQCAILAHRAMPTRRRKGE